MSFKHIHAMNNSATTPKMMIYKHSLLLFKIWNESIYSKDWLALNFQQNVNERTNFVMIFETINLKIGKNLVTNRLKIMNGLINFDWLNLKLNS